MRKKKEKEFFNTKVEVVQYGRVTNWQLSEFEGLRVPVKIRCPICEKLSGIMPFDCRDKGSIGVPTPISIRCKGCEQYLHAFIFLYESEMIHCDVTLRFVYPRSASGEKLEEPL